MSHTPDPIQKIPSSGGSFINVALVALRRKGIARSSIEILIAKRLTDAEILPGAWDPLLPAKQRVTHPNDWMTTDAEVACPDPHCGARFRITRTGLRTFRHSEVTAVPLPDAGAST